MVETSWPSVAGGRAVDDVQYESMAALYGGEGIVGLPSDTPVVYADSTGLQVKIRASKYAQIHGHGWTSGPTELTKVIAGNSSGSTRIDQVVLGLDRSTWAITCYVKAGTPGAGVPPALQRDAVGLSTGKWEIPLAAVTVPNSATTVTAAQCVPNPVWLANGQYRTYQTVTTAVASVTFSNIPATLRNLRLTWTARDTEAASGSYMFLRINNDSSNHYAYQFRQIQNTTQSNFANAHGLDRATVGIVAGASTGSTNFASGVLEIPAWNAPHNTWLTWLARSYLYGDTAPNAWLFDGGGAMYTATSPYTSLTLFPAASSNFAAGSEFVLSGME